MSDFVDINVTDRVITMFFGVNIPTDNIKTSISVKDIKSVSQTKEFKLIVTLEDGRVWELSALKELIPNTFPIDNWNGIEINTNNELFNKIENLIL
jgi:hypothetical protein